MPPIHTINSKSYHFCHIVDEEIIDSEDDNKPKVHDSIIHGEVSEMRYRAKYTTIHKHSCDHVNTYKSEVSKPYSMNTAGNKCGKKGGSHKENIKYKDMRDEEENVMDEQLNEHVLRSSNIPYVYLSLFVIVCEDISYYNS